MDERPYNAKKDRASKLKRDKYHSKHHKPPGKPAPGKSSAPPAQKEATSNQSKPSALQPPKTKVDTGSSSDEDVRGTSLYARRTLASNWSRYELDPHECSSDSDGGAASFEDLLKALPSGGTHLKLRHEQEWDKERSELQAPWFRLDLQKLDENLSSIPFYKRHDLSENLFSEEKLNQMNLRASQNAVSTQSIKDRILSVLSEKNEVKLEETSKVPVPVPVPDSGSESPSQPAVEMQARPVASASREEAVSEDKELDGLLALGDSEGVSVLTEQLKNVSTSSVIGGFKAPSPTKTRSPVPPASSKVNPAPASGDLEDWLDSILDD